MMSTPIATATINSSRVRDAMMFASLTQERATSPIEPTFLSKRFVMLLEIHTHLRLNSRGCVIQAEAPTLSQTPTYIFVYTINWLPCSM